MSRSQALAKISPIESRIHLLRGCRVMLDSDLADLYGVQTRALVQAVKRNRSRFPDDFMFQLTQAESRISRSQTVISSQHSRHGGRRYAPYAFTEQGVAMLSSVLRSPRAIRVNVEIMRAFVRLRQILGHNVDLAQKLDALEKRYDRQFKVVFDAIRQLMEPPAKAQKQIGFRTGRMLEPKRSMRASAGKP